MRRGRPIERMLFMIGLIALAMTAGATVGPKLAQRLPELSKHYVPVPIKNPQR